MVVEVNTIIDQVVTSLAWILGLAAIGIGVWFVAMMSRYKHTVIVREVLNKRKIITVDKFMVWTDPKTGIEWYKLLKFKQQIPVAPQESLEMTRKGKMFCEVYRLPSGEFIFIKDETKDIDHISNDDNFKPITSSQRVIQYHLYESKMKFKRKNWKDLIIPIVGLVALTIIVVALMAFWGDLAKPVLEMGDKVAGMMNQQAEITESLKEIIQKEQVLDGEITNVKTEQAPN